MESTRETYGWLDRVIALLLVGIVAGSVMAFGGQVWWIHLYLGAAGSLLAIAMAVRVCRTGAIRILKSPLSLLAVCMLGLSLLQVAPLPAALSAEVSARRLALNPHAGDRAAPARVSITADRSATFRWIGGAALCLVIFCSIAHFADRVGRMRLICGAIVAAFGACTMIGLLQMMGDTRGAYGAWVPGRAPSYAPSLSDVLAGPGEQRLTSLETHKVHETSWAIPRPILPMAIGPLVAGPGAYLALAALALPLATGLFLHRAAPRGSREPIRARLRHDGGLPPLLLLAVVALMGSALVGYLGNRWVCAAVIFGLAITTLASVLGTGHGRLALVSLTLCAACMGAGAFFARGAQTTARSDPSVWIDALRVIRQHPWLGVGMGAFAAVEPYVKLEDVASTTARSSVLQWWAEGGVLAVALLALGVGWAIVRLPRAWKSVGSADRSLAGAILGACLGFALFSLVHWSIQLIAIALCAAAVLGLANRWLAGGTDLFVEAV